MAQVFVVYVYRWRPNVSCEACLWMAYAWERTRAAADTIAEHLKTLGERVKVASEDERDI